MTEEIGLERDERTARTPQRSWMLAERVVRYRLPDSHRLLQPVVADGYHSCPNSRRRNLHEFLSPDGRAASRVNSPGSGPTSAEPDLSRGDLTAPGGGSSGSTAIAHRGSDRGRPAMSPRTARSRLSCATARRASESSPTAHPTWCSASCSTRSLTSTTEPIGGGADRLPRPELMDDFGAFVQSMDEESQALILRAASGELMPSDPTSAAGGLTGRR